MVIWRRFIEDKLDTVSSVKKPKTLLEEAINGDYCNIPKIICHLKEAIFQILNFYFIFEILLLCSIVIRH